jgi:hypothetical protein
MSLIELNTGSFNARKITAVFAQVKGVIDQHCDAIVIDEDYTHFQLLCAEPCRQELETEFYIKRLGMDKPQPVVLTEQETVNVGGRLLGYLYAGQYSYGRYTKD